MRLHPALSPLAVALLVSSAFGCGATPRSGGASAAACAPEPSHAAKELAALFDATWEHELRDAPAWASSIGDRRYDALWPDVSVASFRRRAEHARATLLRLEQIPRAELGPKDALSYDLFRDRYATAVAGEPYRTWLFAMNQRGGIQTADELADELPFETPQSYADWNARLETFPTYMDQTIELLEEAARTGMVHPRVVMTRLVPQIDAQIVDDPAKSPFFAPYRGPTSKVPKAARDRAAEDARRRIATRVVPAFKKLRAFFVERYLPACRETVGALHLPNGRPMYAHLVRAQTTTKLTPDEVHAIGLREVARIRAEMESVKGRAGYAGTLKEFFAFLRTDPRFFHKDGASLLAAYRELAKRVDPELVRVFRTLPRTPYGVLPIPDAVAPDTTTAYYRESSADGTRAGAFFVNLYKPEARPTWEMVALTLHEAVPGHHLQGALALEDATIPKFRRHGDYTAFVEGWALYAESLGEEMGLYRDVYAKFGQLTYEMWRAVRLVVDTGIHHLGWERRQAIDYFLENTAKAELDVVNEVDRYIVWPGQALAYKIGELRIRELRLRRERALGSRFDLRAFHDAVLRSGAMPLDLLEREVATAP